MRLAVLGLLPPAPMPEAYQRAIFRPPRGFLFCRETSRLHPSDAKYGLSVVAGVAVSSANGAAGWRRRRPARAMLRASGALNLLLAMAL